MGICTPSGVGFQPAAIAAFLMRRSSMFAQNSAALFIGDFPFFGVTGKDIKFASKALKLLDNASESRCLYDNVFALRDF